MRPATADPVVIREARPSGGAALLHLIRAHAAYEDGRPAISPDQFGAILAAPSPPPRIFVAEDRPVRGHAAVAVDFSLWTGACLGHLDRLYVDAPTRGRGIGRALLHHAAAFCRAKGHARMEWQTPPSNRDAIRFYLRENARAAAKNRFAMVL